MALISTSGKNLTEEVVATFLRVLIFDTFTWEVNGTVVLSSRFFFLQKGILQK